jgi:superfamily II DNA or RNA helicase
MLRKHQAEMQRLATDIRSGASKATKIGVYATPGGGKSAIAHIVAKELAVPKGWRICWVVPRDALRKQGEKDFTKTDKRALFGHNLSIRAAGNDIRPSRDTIGYVTTYQAIAQNPKLHEDEFKLRPYILILDECHHVPFKGEGSDEEAAYYTSISPLVDLAKMCIFASGTLERHDGHKIAFWPYTGTINAEVPLMKPSDAEPDWRFIHYSRTTALEEKAIVPLHFHAMDGRARWYDPRTDEERDVSSMAEASKRDQSAVLYVMLDTEYAYQLLDRCIESWRDYKNAVYSRAKLLVVAPSILAAKDYCKYLVVSSGLNALIATSDDSQEAHRNIDAFKGKVDVLVTVGMAYEGLDVPEITHVACLTNIRSRPWIEQCICRANRTDHANGKTHGIIYYPDDPRMKSIMDAIEAEQSAVVVNWPPEREKKANADGGVGGLSIPIVPLVGTVTRERARGLEDGTQTDYDETAAIQAAMTQANMRGVSVVQFKQALVAFGAAVAPNGTAPTPDYNDDIMTPSQLEENLKSSIFRAIGRIANNMCGGDKERKAALIVEINTDVKRMFGGRDSLGEKELRLVLRYLVDAYGEVV